MTTSLVIGSDEGVLEGIAQALAAAGHRAHVVRSMAEAAAVLTEIHPLVTLVDRGCAADRGFECPGVRRARGCAAIPS